MSSQENKKFESIMVLDDASALSPSEIWKKVNVERSDDLLVSLLTIMPDNERDLQREHANRIYDRKYLKAVSHAECPFSVKSNQIVVRCTKKKDIAEFRRLLSLQEIKQFEIIAITK
ncbi:MAG: hypothetical protein ACK4NC_02430 [Candidatus Gracilibacteria bacterium]